MTRIKSIDQGMGEDRRYIVLRKLEDGSHGVSALLCGVKGEFEYATLSGALLAFDELYESWGEPYPEDPKKGGE